ncbi:MAG: CopG family transcriptional regulator [Deltaproteobacteria bacterium]|nr:MAG: CopG family transcriptional regulator [Deltaproteobacteria bacterium]
MATSVKTAISMQEDLLIKVNRIAKELKVSRSRLFVLAVQDFIKKQESQKLLAQINDAFSDLPDAEEKIVQSGMRRKYIDSLGDESW